MLTHGFARVLELQVKVKVEAARCHDCLSP
jgi:hypothetical protein